MWSSRRATGLAGDTMLGIAQIEIWRVLWTWDKIFFVFSAYPLSWKGKKIWPAAVHERDNKYLYHPRGATNLIVA
jgi:hypothetical protein